MEYLRNEKCEIRYNSNYDYKTDCFVGRDLTDMNNEPCFYNMTTRGHKKAWEAIKNMFNENTTMEQVMFILRENNIKTHYWCAID